MRVVKKIMPPALLDASFLIELERELEAGVAGVAMAWLRKKRGSANAGFFISSVSVAEFLEGRAEMASGIDFIGHYRHQPVGFQHATRCAEIQRRARRAGTRFGENDAWQLAVADRAQATIVGRDRKAFTHLGARYEQLD